MEAKELKRLNHKYYLERYVFANADQPIRFSIGFVKGMEAANDYVTNPEKLPTKPKFWFSMSLFAMGFRSAFTRYAGQGAYNDVNATMRDRLKLQNSLDKVS